MDNINIDEWKLKRHIEDISTTTQLNDKTMKRLEKFHKDNNIEHTSHRKVINIDFSKVSLNDAWKMVSYIEKRVIV